MSNEKGIDATPTSAFPAAEKASGANFFSAVPAQGATASTEVLVSKAEIVHPTTPEPTEVKVPEAVTAFQGASAPDPPLFPVDCKAEEEAETAEEKYDRQVI
jgi:hypothetical protein